MYTCTALADFRVFYLSRAARSLNHAPFRAANAGRALRSPRLASARLALISACGAFSSRCRDVLCAQPSRLSVVVPGMRWKARSRYANTSAVRAKTWTGLRRMYTFLFPCTHASYHLVMRCSLWDSSQGKGSLPLPLARLTALPARGGPEGPAAEGGTSRSPRHAMGVIEERGATPSAMGLGTEGARQAQTCPSGLRGSRTWSD
jgi:hypothetical protein